MRTQRVIGREENTIHEMMIAAMHYFFPSGITGLGRMGPCHMWG